jgi:hypothetical protein
LVDALILGGNNAPIELERRNRLKPFSWINVQIEYVSVDARGVLRAGGASEASNGRASADTATVDDTGGI